MIIFVVERDNGNLKTALQKVKIAEDAWNSKDPHKVSLAYTVDTEWRNRDQFINGRAAAAKYLEQTRDAFS